MDLQASFFREADGDLSALKGQTVAIVGYGHLGQPTAANLRDSGVSVVVGSRPGSTSDTAKRDGFPVLAVDEAVATSDVLWLTLPDEVIPEVLSPSATVRPRPGSLVCLSSGYPLAYDLVKLPEDVDVVLVAPRMIGIRIREIFQAGKGFYSFVSVEQDATGTARTRMLALAKALGSLREGALEMPAATEAALDLFVEQTVGPYLGASLLSAFEVGTEYGLPAEGLALELYLSQEMGHTWESFADNGFYAGVRLHGHSSAFGGFIRMGDVDTASMKRQFADTLEDITSGGFANKFQHELASGSPVRALIEAMTAGNDAMSEAEKRLRDAKER